MGLNCLNRPCLTEAILSVGYNAKVDPIKTDLAKLVQYMVSHEGRIASY